MTSSSNSEAGEYVWRQQQTWSRTANRFKESLGQRRTAALGLTIAGAVFATLADQIASLSTIAGKGLAMTAAVAVGLVPLVRRGVDKNAISRWTAARAVSQMLKSEVYTYLAGVAPYRGIHRDERLLKRADELVNGVSDIHGHTVGIQLSSISLPNVHDVGTYIDNRVLDLVNGYYVPSAARLDRNVTLLRRVEFVLAALGVVLGAVAATFGVEQAAAWVGVVTTITVAVLAHGAASRNEEQANEYMQTAAALRRLLQDYRLSKSELESQSQDIDDTFVAHCEELFTFQTRGWAARWANSVD